MLQNSTDLSDLVSSGRDSNPEEVAFAEECLLNCSVFRAERLVIFSFMQHYTPNIFVGEDC